MKYFPYTAYVSWHDGSNGVVNFETEEGLRQWLADLDVYHTKQFHVKHNPQIIGQTYDLEVKYQK